MLDYRLLAALTAIIDSGSFAAAAERLYLTQSAVSQRVKQLEERLGQILLVRESPPRPTPAGELLLKHFRQVMLLEQELPASLGLEPRSGPVSVPLGVNADSLATWLWPALLPVLDQRELLLDLRVEDQDVTAQLLQRGEVVGCISASPRPPQGCRATYLGTMVYHLCATPDFCRRWFPRGLTLESAARAPVAIYSREDVLHRRLLRRNLGRLPSSWRPHYLPAQEAYNTMVTVGQAYGCLPEQQCLDLFAAGRLVELAPEGPEGVDLYWHCWNLSSELLDELQGALRDGARRLLAQRQTGG